MSEYDNEKTIVLFENSKTKDTQPDYTGRLTLDGVQYDVALWNKTAKSGKRYLNGKVKESQAEPQIERTVAQTAATRSWTQPKTVHKADDDGIPF